MHHESTPQPHDSQLDSLGEIAFPADLDIAALKELYESNDDKFSGVLDDIAYDLIFENEDLKSNFTANLATMRSHASELDKKHAAENNRAIYARAKQLVLHRAGIKDIIVDEIEHAKIEINRIISEDRKKHGSNADALTALGILKQDSEGKDRFSYPRNLMPDSTNNKWHKYIKAVKDHVAAADNRENHGILMAFDRARRYAHNSVSKDIQSLLSFSDDDEGFEEARKLVAKMRENRFPTMETGERSRVESKVQKGMGGSVLAILRSHQGELYDPEKYQGH